MPSLVIKGQVEISESATELTEVITDQKIVLLVPDNHFSCANAKTGRKSAKKIIFEIAE